MIGWYVHHQGSGHRTRARCIAAHLGEPVVGLSSLPRRPGLDDCFEDWITLPADDAGPAAVDVTAGGTLHWAPRRDAGVADRVAAIVGWLAAARPRVLVVDVSVEVALLARLAGIPVVVVALPGDRGDGPHQQALAAADLVLACWRQEVYDPAWLRPHAARVAYVGAISRFDGRRREPATEDVVVLDGTGGPGLAGGSLVAARAATPGRRWRVLAAEGWTPDPWSALCGAAVVVTHGGQNALAEVAAARARAVVIPQPRPFREQERTAAALGAAGIALTAPSWDVDWPALLTRAAALDPSGWARWSSGDGARTAAAAIAAVA